MGVVGGPKFFACTLHALAHLSHIHFLQLATVAAISLVTLNCMHSLHVSWIVMQVRSDGTLMDTNDSSSYYWLPKTLLGEVRNMSPSKLVPQISTPFSTTPLGELVYLLQNAMKHNFLSSVLVVSGGIMALHYENIREIFGGCPVVVATGNPETGKSTSMKAVAALYGQ